MDAGYGRYTNATEVEDVKAVLSSKCTPSRKAAKPGHKLDTKPELLREKLRDRRCGSQAKGKRTASKECSSKGDAKGKGKRRDYHDSDDDDPYASARSAESSDVLQGAQGMGPTEPCAG